MKRDWRLFLVRPEVSLVEATRVIDSGGGQIAIVTNEDLKLLGTVTDADVRKALLNSCDLNAPCATYMSANPISLPDTSSRQERIDVMRKRHIGQLPLIDADGRVTDVVLMTELYLPETQPNTVVIMAGGLGTRLAHLTRDKPKPLLDIGGRPLLETILKQLIEQGFSRFVLSLNYKAEMIMDHFGDGSDLDVEIRYVREKKRLGTAGALHLLQRDLDHDLIVMNGDILSRADFRRLLLFHRRSGAAATMAVKDFEMVVPYGVVDIDQDNRINSLIEKPTHRFFINAGIYALSPMALGYIPQNEFFDMPSLFNLCAKQGHKTAAYPLREYWIDIGQIKDLERANFEFHSHFTT
jgi:dTDP-glucose pyrophosphorylase